MYTNLPNTHCDATLFCLICSKGYSTLEVRLAAAATMTTTVAAASAGSAGTCERLCQCKMSVYTYHMNVDGRST